tara:strand:+ start:293 stop:802 length:510 start_codon:yes stop_codon:yes gene_type:complete
MDKEPFNKLMFRTAFCVSACDGEIHELEIEEIRKISVSKPFFGDIEIEAELDILLAELKEKRRAFFSDYFKNLEEQDIDEIQKLLLFEVTLNIIYADEKLDENEVKFLRALKKRLNLEEALILDRFGNVKALGIEKAQEYETLSSTELADMFTVDEIQELKIGEDKLES